MSSARRKGPVRVAVIGTGGMGWQHLHTFAHMKGVKLVACCDLDGARARAMSEEHGASAHYSDYRELFDAERIDGVSIVTPDATHAGVAIAAARRGLHVLCEKPLATNVAEARRMVRAVEKAGVIHLVNLCYRNSAALQEGAALIRRGRLGRIMHVEASYLQSWLHRKVWGDWMTSPHWLWRLSTQHGSMGTLGDIGSHLYDAVTLLAGPFAEMQCVMKTFDKGVRGNRVGKYKLDANDSFVTTVHFEHGALGTVHASRWAMGQMNSLRFRVFGDKGAIDIDLDRSWDEYGLCAGRNVPEANWVNVKAKPTRGIHERFIRAIRTGRPDSPDFRDGLRVQKYIQGSFDSNEKKGPIKVRG